jgi:quercetin dioxygenase-like cupin family protein
VEIVPFGPGLRREQPAGGGQGVAEQVIWDHPYARVTELAFGPRAVLPPRSSPRQALFVIVAGGGWVQVGDERAAVNHGEAVVWPPNVAHGAWTDGTHLRALLIEVPDVPETPRLVHEGVATAVASDPTDDPGTVTPAQGRLVAPSKGPEDHDPAEGEPW